MTDRPSVESWVSRYEEAWRSAGTGALRELFDERASYRMGPFEKPAEGLEEIGELWERQRQGPDEEFEMGHEIVAVDGAAAVVRVDVEYGSGEVYRDVWILRFAADGRCAEFEEWPFWPGQPLISDRGGTG